MTNPWRGLVVVAIFGMSLACKSALPATALKGNLVDGSEKPRTENLGEDCAGCTGGSGGTNARGVHNIEGGDMCISSGNPTAGRFCPYQIISDPSDVKIAGVRLANGTSVSTSYPLSATYDGVSVKLLGFEGTNTDVQVRYSVDEIIGNQVVTSIKTIGPINFHRLILSFQFASSVEMLMEIKVPAPVPGSIQAPAKAETWLKWRWEGGSSWQGLCKDHLQTETHALLYRGASFDPFTGQRVDDPRFTTIACQEGAIAKCMEWGYLPWKTGKRLDNSQVESLKEAHVACIQMKRAAYCGGASYTKNGTPFKKQDVYGIQMDTAGEKLEAVWTSAGAACLNHEDNRRHPEMTFPGCPNQNNQLIPLPLCPGSPSQWWQLSKLGKLAKLADGL